MDEEDREKGLQGSPRGHMSDRKKPISTSMGLTTSVRLPDSEERDLVQAAKHRPQPPARTLTGSPV